MARSSALLKLACAVLFCMAAAAPLAEAAGITCGVVASKVTPCLSYLKNNIPVPPACCAGIRSLNGLASTGPDRRAACNCLKTIATSASGISYPKAAALPGKCGVRIPYVISPTTDCTKVN